MIQKATENTKRKLNRENYRISHKFFAAIRKLKKKKYTSKGI